MYVSALQANDRRWSQCVVRAQLGNQKLRGIEQEPIINCQRAAERSLDAEAEADSMRPVCSQIYRCQRIAGGVRFRVAKDIAHAAKHIATIIEGHSLKIPGQGYPRLEIQHDHRVSAQRYGKWIQKHRLALAIVECALRQDCLTGTGFLIAEAAQSRRASGEETLANRQGQIGFVNYAIAIAIARIEKVRQP